MRFERLDWEIVCRIRQRHGKVLPVVANNCDPRSVQLRGVSGHSRAKADARFEGMDSGALWVRRAMASFWDRSSSLLFQAQLASLMSAALLSGGQRRRFRVVDVSYRRGRIWLRDRRTEQRLACSKRWKGR